MVHALCNRAVTRLRQRDPAGAVEDCDRAIAADPRCAVAHFTRGYIRQEQGRIDDAISDYTRVIEIDPGQEDAWGNRGDIYWAYGKRDLAAADYRESLKVAPPEWPARKVKEQRLREVE